MKVTNVAAAKAYNPPLHNGMVALKLSDKALTGAEKFWCGMSHFLPGGGADWAYEDSPTEKLYYVISGELVIKTKEGEQTVRAGDAVFLAPFEGRSVINKTNYPASMLVVAMNS
ncbi:cupin [Rubrivivax gelatinosus]|jgi:glyoxylate utilization-related uncharacterized protein|uniref:Cupin n=1 Tax=Rubrivivax gelatinosus TaxID=28068 RepID=A0ABS1DSI8_RUBGE|nr:cupin domain-containing protein [Rubrivivax gelatinosus]MBK1616502.1 cupin [Rubrivivax gelatinosus]MBK1712324.1 cupin [Rubrivivax gelatinosus]